VAESAKKLSAAVAGQLKGEMSQLKEDIKVAKENNFGRRIFESFASEFSVTHLSEKQETRKLMQALAEKEQQLAESQKEIDNTKKLVESKEREVRIIKESNQREKLMGDLLGSLNEEKAKTMQSLLESVQTSKLQATFDKYLPAVLNTGADKKPVKQAITESRISEVTGDKSAKQEVEVVDNNNVIDLKRLAGL
jgi:hypothetical protein